MPRWTFYVLFTVSGFAGLIYESIWTHYLKLFLGHAAYAQSLVVFMGRPAALELWRAQKTKLRAPAAPAFRLLRCHAEAATCAAEFSFYAER